MGLIDPGEGKGVMGNALLVGLVDDDDCVVPGFGFIRFDTMYVLCLLCGFAEASHTCCHDSIIFSDSQLISDMNYEVSVTFIWYRSLVLTIHSLWLLLLVYYAAPTKTLFLANKYHYDDA